MSGAPPADIDVTPDLVHKLLSEQHPEFAHLPLTEVAAGWDNIMFRLGPDLAIRIPRRQYFAHSIQKEQEFLPKLTLTLPTPIPVKNGHASNTFPYAWSIVPWLPGEPADLAPPHMSQAKILAHFLQSLHQPAPPNAPASPFRGVPIAERSDYIHENISKIKQYIIPTHHQILRNALKAKPNQDPVLIHGDLHPQNILVQNREISAVIDWGDLCAGDPATDLAAFYMLFSEPSMIFYYTEDASLISRAKGWALFFACVLITNGEIDNPRHVQIGLRTLQNLALN